MVSFCGNLMPLSQFTIKSDSFVYQSSYLDPRMKILVVFNFAGAGQLGKQRCASNWLKPHYTPYQIWCSHYFFCQ